MSFIHDRRGQSVVIGTVILFGFLIVALAVYQAFGVPAQNAEIEVSHNDDAQADMTDLRNALLDVRVRSDVDRVATHRSVQIRLGTRYPSRILTVNPPPATGTLQSQDDVPDIQFENARVVGGGYTNTDSILNEPHETSLLTYRPGYNEYREAPQTTFEHSLLYNRFDGANLTLTDQRAVDGNGRELDIVVYDGDVNEQGLRTTVDPATLDGPSIRIPIEGDGENITLTLPTNSPEIWEEVIGEERNAEVIATTSNTVTIELDDGDVWDLRMTRVGVDGGEADDLFSNVTAPEDDRGVALNRTFDVRWLGDEIAEEDGITFNAGENLLEIDRSETGDTVGFKGDVFADGDRIDDATVDLSTTSSAVAGFEVSSVTTDEGRFQTSLDISNEEGLARLFAASGDDTDDINVDVFGEADEAEPDIQVRVDDLTDRRPNDPGFYVSYEVSEAVDEVVVSAESTQSSASDEATSSAARNGELLTPGFGEGQQFAITVEAFEDGQSVAERTVFTNADTQNPSNNDDLSQANSATLESSTVRDQTNTQQNDPLYRFTYTVSGTGSFSEVQLHALSRDGDAASDSVIRTQRSGNNIRVDPNDGANAQYKLAILVVDDDGIVVDDRILDDVADGNDP